MAANKIYTIGREYASSGMQVGMELAKRLGIPYYDKELLARAAKDSGFCEEILETHDEKPTNSLLYSIVFDTYSATGASTGGFLEMPLNHKVFLAQFEAIKKIAEEGPCVIVGRCADYALADRDDVVSVFIKAPLEHRIAQVMKDENCTEKQAKDIIAKTDKKRASYYNYYTSKKWGDAKSYDLCINSALIGVDGCVDLIESYANAIK